jgi:hypothetical protein
VVIVSVTGAVDAEGVNVTVAGLKMQMLFGGRFEHIDGERVTEPVKPFFAANVSVVDPDCPGLAMLIAVGLAAIANVPPTSREMMGDTDPV